MTCSDVTEKLPWLINGGLEAEEQEALSAHLRECATCRAEWNETLVWWGMISLHVPSRDLSLYANGAAPEAWSIEQLEDHLELCGSCRDELALAGRGTEEQEAASAWKARLRMAATIFGTMLLGVWLGTSMSSDRQSGREATLTAAEEELANGGVEPMAEVAASADTTLFSDSFEGGLESRWSWVVGKSASAR